MSTTSQPVLHPRPIAGPGIPMARQQIAEAMGVSRSLVWQIEQRALLKIREELRKQGFDPAELCE